MDRLFKILAAIEDANFKTHELKESIIKRMWTRNTTFSVKNDIDVEVDFLSDHLSKLAAQLTMDMKVYELKVKLH